MSERRYDIDTIRTIAVVLLILFVISGMGVRFAVPEA